MPLLHLRVRVEAADHDRAVLVAALEVLGGRTGVLGELLHLLGQGRHLDGEVHHQLGAERFAELHLACQAAVGRDVVCDRRVLQVLGTDPDHERLALEVFQRRAGGEVLFVELQPRVAERRDEPAVLANELSSTRFIAGDPMKPPTKRLRGRS